MPPVSKRQPQVFFRKCRQVQGVLRGGALTGTELSDDELREDNEAAAEPEPGDREECHSYQANGKLLGNAGTL